MSSPPRVLHVSQPSVAGVPAVVESLARDQTEHGWQVDVACPGGGALAERLSGLGVRVHPWEATRGPGRSVRDETARLRAIVAAARPTVIHLHSSKAGLAGRLAVRGRTPTVFQPHSWSFLAVEGVTRRATVAWERWASRWASATICVSEDEAREGRDIGVRCDLRVIPNGIDVPRDVVDDPATARADLGLPEAPTAVCLGRLAQQKGQDRLLRIWPEVRRAVPEAHLVLVGDGPDRDRLTQRAARTGGVTLAGHQHDVWRWLAVGDVVVLPSRWEAGLTLAAMEAMAAGRSVVATAFEGMGAGFPPGAGAVVGHEDDAALRDAVVLRLHDREVGLSEGAVGRGFVTTRCSLSATTRAVRALYAEVARAPA
jgi:glycosyltransferase involved in cell wall biosynthesis